LPNVTLSPEQLARMLEQVPDDWRPLFACGPALGLRKGELFALAKSDVDLDRGTITVARSHDRDTTKGGAAAILPLPATLRSWIEYQVKHAPGSLLFPGPGGSQRSRETIRRRFSGTRFPGPALRRAESTAVAGAATRSGTRTASRVTARLA
jgi:integrase